MTADNLDSISATAQDYYDSDNAFNFYKQVWGGEHIHVGLYSQLQGEDAELTGVSRITKASSLCTKELLARSFPADGPPPASCTVVDLGSGYGGTARTAAKEYGCKVECVNIAKRENEVNAALNKAAGLSDKVTIDGAKSFFDTGLPDTSCDVVLSQDALLHAGSERHRALAEASRVLKPGGLMVFTDIMQAEEADPKDLQEVYQRIHLDDMATPTAYEESGKQHGLKMLEFVNMSDNIKIHYGSVRDVLASRRGNLEGVEDSFVDNMVRGLDAWTSAAAKDLIRWGFLVLKKEDGSDECKTPGGNTHSTGADTMCAISTTAQDYYDSDNAFNFYRQVWGGEHIHVGLYSRLQGKDAELTGVSRITKASALCTKELLARSFPADGPPPASCTVVDMGSGYGGTARTAAKEYGCKVECVNISKRENEVNAALNKAAGLSDKVTIEGAKSFFDTGLPDTSCDVVLSQDALLHAGSERHRALAEASRVLKPGGLMVFTDIMQSEEADPKDLQDVYRRIHLDDMATPSAYGEWGKKHGLKMLEFYNMTDNITAHYGLVRKVLESRRGDLEGVEDSFVDNMIRGLDAWTSATADNLIRWGFVVLQKTK